MNSRSELHGSCRHKTKFHRLSLKKTSISADDRKKRENVDGIETKNANKRRRLSDSSIGFDEDDIMICLPVEDQDDTYSPDGSEIATHLLTGGIM